MKRYFLLSVLCVGACNFLKSEEAAVAEQPAQKTAWQNVKEDFAEVGSDIADNYSRMAKGAVSGVGAAGRATGNAIKQGATSTAHAAKVVAEKTVSATKTVAQGTVDVTKAAANKTAQVVKNAAHATADVAKKVVGKTKKTTTAVEASHAVEEVSTENIAQ